MTISRPQLFWALALSGSAFFAFAFAGAKDDLPLLAMLAVGLGLGLVLPSPRPVWYLFLVWLTLNASISIVYLIWAPWDWLNGAYGLYGNHNYLGCSLAFGIAVALAYGWYWFLPLALLDLAFLGSRGAIVGAAVALSLWLWPRVRWLVFIVAVLGFVLVRSVGFFDTSMFQRLGIWHDVFNHMTVWGHGWGSFYEAYWAFPVHTNVTLERPIHAYNDILEVVFMLGLGSIPLWVFLALALEDAPAPLRLIAWTFFVLGLTFFPLFIPGLGPLFGLALGHQIRERHFNGTLGTQSKALYPGEGYPLALRRD